jgi:hypothetical protein
MGVWRMRPVWIQQSPMECWAAAISSWSRVVPGVPNWTVSDVKAVFDAAGHVQADGSLDTIPGCEWFVAEYGLAMQEIVMPGGTAEVGWPSVSTLDLEYGHFKKKLMHSHVLTVFAPADPGGLAHWVVVYGADPSAICRMDPLESVPDYKTRKPCEPYEDFGWGAPKYLTIWRA